MEIKAEINTEGKKISSPAWAEFVSFPTSGNSTNPWFMPSDIDKLEFSISDNEEDTFKNTVKASRFFYKKDPLASTIINKLVDIGITELTFTKGTLSANEVKIFKGISNSLQEFAENLALEFLISGLVVPEIAYERVNKEVFQDFNIKKYDYLYLPTSMWIRDPSTIKIKSPRFMNEPSYFIKIPEELINFINGSGAYSSEEQDKELLQKLTIEYPEFVLAAKAGKKELLLDNKLIFRRRYLTDSPYPVPYLSPAIELLKHKRNLRRMDYAVAARVISAIQLIKLGSDEFPLTEDDQEQFNAIKEQLAWRDTFGREMDRVFQLFANHTLSIEWVFPPTESLLDDAKYTNVNQDIFYALGFPKVLVIGESERSNAGTAEYTSLSPVKTMEAMRRKILVVLQNIVNNVSDNNSLKYTPTINFKPLRLENFAAFSDALNQLYTTGNLSRTSYAEALGFNFDDEINIKSDENKLLKSLGVEEFAPQPFSPQPGNNTSNQPQTKDTQNSTPNKQEVTPKSSNNQ
jgi:hypothetical protein